MCFGIRISSPIHPTTLTIPIQNQKCLKNAKKCIRGQQFPPCHLKCSRDFVVFTNAFTSSPNQICVCRHCYPSTTDEQYKKEPKVHHFSSSHSQISEEQACLRNIACEWLWCFTSYHTLFSESTVVEKLNPQGRHLWCDTALDTNGSLFRTFVMWNIHGHCSRKQP